MAPLVRTGGSRHTGLAAPPHRNIHPVPVSSALQFFQTLNTYSHLYPNKQAEVAQQLENLINGTTVPDSSQLADVANKKKNL